MGRRTLKPRGGLLIRAAALALAALVPAAAAATWTLLANETTGCSALSGGSATLASTQCCSECDRYGDFVRHGANGWFCECGGDAGGGTFSYKHGFAVAMPQNTQGTNSDITSVTVDSAGRLHIAGNLVTYSNYYGSQAVRFGPVANKDSPYISVRANSRQAGGQDAFAALLDNTGVVLWAVSWGGSGRDPTRATGVASDGDGNTYVVGVSQASDWSKDGHSFERSMPQSSGNEDGWHAKLDRFGKMQWVVPFGGNGKMEMNGVSADAQGDSYAIGSYKMTATFGTGDDRPSFTTAQYNGNGFLCKTDTSGKLQWAMDLGSGGGADDAGLAVAARADGSAVYATGEFAATASFGGKTLTAGKNGGKNVFVIKVDPSGDTPTVLWAKALGQPMGSRPYSLAIDRKGDLRVAGTYTHFRGSSETFGAFTLSAPPADPNNGQSWNKNHQQAFLVKLGAEDGEVAWFMDLTEVYKVMNGGSQAGEGDDRVTKIAVDKNGNTFLCGENELGHYIARVNPAGSLVQWAQSTTKPCQDMAFDDFLHSLFVVGSFTGQISFGGISLNAGSGTYQSSGWITSLSSM